MENIKHIFFDLDNTLWDYRKNAEFTLKKLFKSFGIEEKHGISFDEFYAAYYEINDLLWEGFSAGTISREEIHQRRFTETLAKLNIDDFEMGLEIEKRFMNEVAQSDYLVEGAEEVLHYLKGKYRLHILSNGFKAITHQKINGCMIKDFVETITTSEDAGIAKPHPTAFQTALDQSDARPDNSLYIGDDWVADMVGATGFGMKAIYFNPLNETHPWIEHVPVIEQLIELKSYL